MLHEAGTMTLYLAAFVWTACLVYHLTAKHWWRYEVSRHLALLFGTIAVVLDLVAVRNMFGQFGHYSAIRAVVFGLVPIAGLLTLYLQIKWRRRGRREAKEEATWRRSQSL